MTYRDHLNTCATCRTPAYHDAHHDAFCACCGDSVCLSCREEIGGLTHCPDCAANAREFINGGERRVPAEVPRDGKEQLLW